LEPGAPLFAEDFGRQFTATVFSGTELAERKNRPKTILSSEDFRRVFSSGHDFDPRSAGGAVLTVGGSIAGILAPIDGRADSFIPVHLIRPIVADAFKRQTPVRPKLGVNYVDLSAVAVNFSTGPTNGALITGSKKDGVPAIVAQSAAGEAGLKEGDVIVRVDDVELTGGHDLAETIAEYRPGDRVRLEFIRGGERQTVQAVLK